MLAGGRLVEDPLGVHFSLRQHTRQQAHTDADRQVTRQVKIGEQVGGLRVFPKERRRQTMQAAVRPVLDSATGGANGDFGLGVQSRPVATDGDEESAERIDQLPGQGILELAVSPDREEHRRQSQLDSPGVEVGLRRFRDGNETGVRELGVEVALDEVAQLGRKAAGQADGSGERLDAEGDRQSAAVALVDAGQCLLHEQGTARVVGRDAQESEHGIRRGNGGLDFGEHEDFPAPVCA